MRRDVLELVLSSILALSAATVAVLFVKRELRPETQLGVLSVEEVGQPSSSYLKEWAKEAAAGIRLGTADAKVTIVEFMDLECPYCRSLAMATDSLMSEYPNDVAVVVHHYPLSNHRFARPAAVAVECADKQGAFVSLYRILFEQQDSVGLKTMTEFARDAGVPNLEAFDECTRQDDHPRIEYGRSLGERIGLRATPTVLINGYKLSRPPSLQELRRSVREVLAGRRPIAVRTAPATK